jgi:pimeloyl-ACP methyl ester carboxylesterase
MKYFKAYLSHNRLRENKFYCNRFYSTLDELKTAYPTYRFETHKINVDDKYYLHLFRVVFPQFQNKFKAKLLLQHGSNGSAMSFLINDEEKSIGLRLAKEGYDVWLANFRGNKFNPPPVDQNERKKYYEFSFYELGHIDMPYIVDYINKYGEKSKLICVAHSQGGAVIISGFSTKSDFFNKNINGVILLAPAVSLKSTENIFLKLFSLLRIDDFIISIGIRRIFNYHNYSFLRYISKKFHRLSNEVISFISGKDDSINKVAQIRFISNYPSGTNVICYSQFFDIYRNKKFVYRDRETNRVIAYDFSKIKNKFIVCIGENDKLTSQKDLNYLEESLGNNLLESKIFKKASHSAYFITNKTEIINYILLKVDYMLKIDQK